jgi:hypothetical protein
MANDGLPPSHVKSSSAFSNRGQVITRNTLPYFFLKV